MIIISLNKFLNIKEPKLMDHLENNEFGIKFKEIKFDSILFSAFVQLKCMNCGMFRRNYHCLAVPRWKKAKETLSGYNKFYLVYKQMDNTIRIKDYEEKREEMRKSGKRVFNDWLLKRNAINANQVQLYSIMRRFMIQLKVLFPGKKYRFFGAGGGCRSCRVCGLVLPHMKNEERVPCKKPEKSFNAPESWGIDVYSTLKNNNIEFEVIPENLLNGIGLIVVK